MPFFIFQKMVNEIIIFFCNRNNTRFAQLLHLFFSVRSLKPWLSGSIYNCFKHLRQYLSTYEHEIQKRLSINNFLKITNTINTYKCFIQVFLFLCLNTVCCFILSYLTCVYTGIFLISFKQKRINTQHQHCQFTIHALKHSPPRICRTAHIHLPIKQLYTYLLTNKHTYIHTYTHILALVDGK